MKKSRSTRFHFRHARSCSRARETIGLPFGRILCDKDIFFLFDRFTGYKKSNQNQFGRVLPFAFALTCCKIYLLSLPCWFIQLMRASSYGVCRLRARVHLKTLCSLLKTDSYCPNLVPRARVVWSAPGQNSPCLGADQKIRGLWERQWGFPWLCGNSLLISPRFWFGVVI